MRPHAVSSRAVGPPATCRPPGPDDYSSPPVVPTYAPWLPDGAALPAAEVGYWQDAPDDDGYNFTWRTDGDFCNAITMVFVPGEGCSGAHIERETRRIAESMVPTPPDSTC